MNFEVPPERFVHIFESYEKRKRSEEIEFLQRTFEDELCLLEGLQSCKHTGINTENIETRKQMYGENIQPQPPGPTFCKLYLEAYRDYPIKLLLLLALALIVVSAIVRLEKGVDWAEGLSVLLTIQFSILVSVFNNLHKVHIFKKLTKNYEQLQRVTVVRDGSEMLIHPTDLVVGDVCLIDTYQVLPCDGVLLEEGQPIQTQPNFFESSRISSYMNLQEYSGLIADQTILGSKEAAKKASLSFCTKEAQMAASGCNKMAIPSPVLMAGTTIIKGSGRMLVLAVGENSSRFRNSPQQSFLSQLIPATPLQTDLIKLSSKLSLYGKVMAAILVIVMFTRFLLQRLNSQNWNLQEDLSKSFEILLLGSCILVLSVPEGLPLSVAISIAYSLESIFADGSLIRNIEVCETIGLVTDLCIDKDGLLVEDKLKGNSLFSFEMEGMLEVADGIGAGVPKGSAEFKSKLGLCLTNKICLDQSRWTRIEEAFRELANYYKVRPYPVLSRHSVEESRSVISIKYILLSNKKINVLKGTPSKLLQFCGFVFDDGKHKEMTDAYRDDILEASRRIELKGESPILLAYNEGKGVIFLALVGLQEEVKPNICESLEKLESSGIHSYVLIKQGKDLSDAFIQKIKFNLESGRDFMDAKQFFSKIGGLVCKRCRVSFCDCPYDVALAKNMEVEPRIDTIADKESFSKLLGSLAGLYNCGPREKYALVVGLRDIGRIVAVTSNTYEDKLTLRNSDVGFVSNGSSYKHDLGHIGGVNLLQSNIEAITRSILWGRNVISSVQKFLVVHLTANLVAIILTIYGGSIWQEGILKPVHLLWINLLIDNLAAMVLATEPRQERLSQKATQYKLISRPMVIKIVVLVFYQLVLLITIYNFGEYFLPEFADSYDDYIRSRKRDTFVNKYRYETRPRNFLRSGRSYTITGEPDYIKVYRDMGVQSRHLTIIFNLFVVLQVFNFISCRKVYRGATWKECFKKNRTYFGVLIAVLIAQYLIISFGRSALRVHYYGLALAHWITSILFGLVQLGITGLLSYYEQSSTQLQTSKQIVDYRIKSSLIKPRGLQQSDYRSSLFGTV